MLQLSDIPVERAIAAFAKLGVSAAFVVPTHTGLTKSIMDAHGGLRDFLSAEGIHDFHSQGQGPSEKRVVDINFYANGQCSRRQLSLYRPETKSGDPRIWISRLKDFAVAGNLIALFLDRNGQLSAVNCSMPRVLTSSATSKHTGFESADFEFSADSGIPLAIGSVSNSQIEAQLIAELRRVNSQGWVDNLRPGDTGVGFTLETLLGIAANSRRTPDYHGIELKSGRLPVRGRGGQEKQTLFAKTPNWVGSRFSARELLENFGYKDDAGRHALYVTVGSAPNAQGLHLEVDPSGTALHVVSKLQGPAVTWELQDLRESLETKHPVTCWVKAVRRLDDGREQFRYVNAVVTGKPLTANLPTLLSIGKVTLDFAMHLKPNGAVRDHGYLFRMKRSDLSLLFPEQTAYDLSSEGSIRQ